MPKLEVRRQAKLHSRVRRRPLVDDGSARFRRPQGRRGRTREPASPWGARVVSWLQKSERSIFLDGGARRGATRGERCRRDSLRRPTSLLTRRVWLVAGDRVRGEGRAREQRARLCPLGPRGLGRSDGRRSGPFGVRRPNPAAGPAGLAWRGPHIATYLYDACVETPLRRPFEARVGARSPRGRDATESVRGSHVRSGFLSRWAQEVGGLPKVPTRVIIVPRRDAAG